MHINKKILTLFLTAVLFFSVLQVGASALADASSTDEAENDRIILVERAGTDEISTINDLDMKILDRYNNYALVEGSDSKIETLKHRGVEFDPLEERTVLSIGGQEFDFTEEEPDVDLKKEDYASGLEGLYIVHTLGPVNPEWVATLQNMDGVQLLDYVPNYAYTVKMKPKMRSQVESLDFIDWTGVYHPGYKIDPEIKQVDGVRGLEKIKVFMDGTTDLKSASQVVSNLENIEISTRLVTGEYKLVGYVYEKKAVRDIAKNPEVTWITPFKEKELKDEIGTQIVGGFFDVDNPGDSPYRGEGNYGSHVNQIGYKGQDITIQVADTGLGDGTTPNAGHNDFTGRVKGGSDLGSTVDGWNDGYGHGTHCAGLATGDTYNGNGVTYAGWTDFYVGQGSAPEAKIWASQIFEDDGSGDFPSDYYTILEDGKVNGEAYISTNSWGESRGDSQYSEMDTSYDAAVRDADNTTAGEQPMSIFVSAGNGGPGENTITSPATAKNVIAVGASKNYMPDSTSYGNSGSDTTNPADIADFSSRGFEMDGRVKPDVAAPGQADLSTHSPDVSGSNLYGLYTEDGRYEWCDGTSMAGPTAAGAGAVIAGYYEDTYGEKPSPEMVKALMINAAKDMDDTAGNTGPIPNPDEGWGRVFLPPIMDHDMYPTWRLFDRPTQLETGDSESYTVRVADDDHPLNITLAYSDAPGEPDSGTESKPALKNDLWLKVTGPNGDVWYGNAFENGMSVAGSGKINSTFDPDGDDNDDKNNVENVFIPKSELESGAYEVEVVGKNVVEDAVPSTPEVDQDYALAVFNSGGGLGKNGTIEFTNMKGEGEYQGNDLVNITLEDRDLIGEGTYDVNVTSDTEPMGETVTLTEVENGTFEGNITTSLTDAPGVLHVSHGDTITAHYTDEDPGYDGSGYTMANDGNNKPMATDDVGVAEITSPEDRVNTNTHTVSSTVHNYGTNDLTGVPVNTTIGEIVTNNIAVDENFTDGLPASWSVTDVNGNAHTWNESLGPYMQVTSNTSDEEDNMTTATYNLSSSDYKVELTFDSMSDGSNDREVYVSTDGGTTWNLVGEASTDGRVQMDLTEWAAGESSVQVRFRFYNGYHFAPEYWSVDNVTIEGKILSTEYADETTVDVTAGANATASFTDWTPSGEAEYVMNSTTELSGETNTTNDYTVKTITVVDDHDVASDHVISPTGTIGLTTQSVEANIDNYGTFDENVPVNATIEKFVGLSEDFSGTFPPTGWTTESGDWSQSSTANAGGSSPEANLYYFDITGDYSYLQTPATDTTGSSSLSLNFNSYIDDYGGGYYCNVSVRPNTTAGWTDVTPWSQPVSGDVGPSSYSMDVSSYIGTGTQVRFEFAGTAWDMNDWYLDDVQLGYPTSEYTDETTVWVNKGEDANATFADWTPSSEGSYIVNITTELTNDNDNSNDYVTEQVDVIQLHDFAPTEITSPPNVFFNRTKNVNATVGNFGTTGETSVPVNTTIHKIEGIMQGFSGDFPPIGWETESGDWIQSDSSEAGGSAPEADLNWNAITDGSSYLQTPTVDTTGAGSLDLSFNSYISHYSSSYEYSCKVMVRASSSESWTDVTPWSNPIDGNVGPDSYSVDISNHTGSETQVRFEFTGDSFGINDWYLDDVQFGGMSIEYMDEQTIDLDAGNTTNVPFADWDPSSPGYYIINTTTRLSTDMIGGNDTITKAVYVRPIIHDLATQSVDTPTDWIYRYATDVKATVKNVGNQNETSQRVNAKAQSIESIAPPQPYEDFSGGLPGGWYTTDTDGNGNTWSDAYGEYMEIQAEDEYEEGMLVTQTLDCSGATHRVLLEFNSTANDTSTNSRDLMISLDDGTTWRQIEANIEDGHHSVDLTRWAADEAQVRLGWRFFSTDPEANEYWRIDDVSVIGEYLASPEYTSDKIISSLNYSEQTQVSFDSWTPTSTGEYLVTVMTTLSNDDDNTNNASTQRILVKENLPPTEPTDPSPADGATDVTHSPVLKVNVSDPNGDKMTVHYYVKNASSGAVVWEGNVTGASGPTVSLKAPYLETNTTFEWYAEASDGYETNTSVNWTFTTYGPVPMEKTATATINAEAPDSVSNVKVDWYGTSTYRDETVWSDDFETDKNWNISQGDWERAEPQGLGANEHGNPDPSEAYSGSNVLGYDLTIDGDYENSITSTWWATSPSMDLSGYDKATLHFERWLNVETNSYDHAYIEVYDGTSWQQVWANPGATIEEDSWNHMSYEVSEYAAGNSDFRIRFGMGPTDGSWPYSGWNIDDVKVVGSEELYIDNVNGNKLTWDASPDDGAGADDVDHYNVYRSSDTSGPWDSTTMITQVSADDSTSYQYLDEGKGRDGTRWHYVIRAIDRVGNKDMNTDVISEMPLPQASNPDPSDGSTVEGMTQTLSIDVTTPTGDPLSVSFYNENTDELIGNQSGVTNGTVSVDWTLTESDMTETHSWYVVASYEGYNYVKKVPVPQTQEEWKWKYTQSHRAEADSAMGITSAGVWHGGIIQDFSGETGSYITDVGYYDFGANASYVKAHVAKDSGGAPGSWLASSDEYTPTGAGWVNLSLNSEVLIEDPGQYWIVLEVDDKGADHYPFGVLNGSVNNGQFINLGGDPHNPGDWEDLQVDHDYNITWCLESMITTYTGEGYTFTLEDTIAPSADAGSDMTVNQFEELMFDASGSTDNVGVTDYKWTIQGTNYTGKYLNHTFTEVGTYEVTLTVSDAAGNQATDTVTVTVNDAEAPTADAGAAQAVGVNEEFTLNASSSTDNVEITSYTWVINGTEYDGEVITHSFSEIGTHEITLNVEDAAGNVGTDTVSIVVMESGETTPPVADAGEDMTVGEGTNVTLNGTNSSDNVGIANYTWIIDGEEYYGETVEHLFEEPGLYNVMLSVKDESGNTDTDIVTITVEDQTAPVADAGSDMSVDEDTAVTLDGGASSDNIGISSYTWTIDGEEYSGEVITQIFQDPGEYQVTLEVTDGGGNTATDNMTVTVADVTAPNADAGDSMTVGSGENVTLDGSASSDNVEVAEYTWTIEGEELTGETVDYTFESVGQYEVTLEVTDGAGNSATDTVMVTVEDATSPTADIGGNMTVKEGKILTLDATGSTDDGEIVDYTWTIDGEEYKGSKIPYVFEEPGSYDVTLTITDSAGNTDSKTTTVDVEETEEAADEEGLGMSIFLIPVIIILVILLILMYWKYMSETSEEPYEEEPSGFEEPGAGEEGFEEPEEGLGGFEEIPDEDTGEQGFEEPDESTEGFEEPEEETAEPEGFEEPSEEADEELEDLGDIEEEPEEDIDEDLFGEEETN